MPEAAPLTPARLASLVSSGEVDTVLVAVPDLCGRLSGKRFVADHFVEEFLTERPSPGPVPPGMAMCNYLLTIDVDMAVLGGYEFATWEQGYGDMLAIPDLATLRLLPWQEKTALVVCDLVDETTGEPVEVSPRQILRRQIERAAERGFVVNIGPELEFFLYRETYEEAAAKGWTDLTPTASYNIDYNLLQPTRDEPLMRAIRNGMNGAGIRVEFSKGEAEVGQHEINVRYAEALEMADRHAIYKHGVKEIAAAHGRSVTFMAKPFFDRVGSSCHLHSSLWDRETGRSLMWSDDDPHHLSPTFRGWLAGLLASAAELAWCFAPYVNSYKRYQPGSWAPTAIGWAHDNRTVGFRVVGHGPAARVEARIPGADCNPYLAYAALIAGGLHGIDAGLELGPPVEGNGYTAADLPRIPTTLVDAIGTFERSEVARNAFGPAVHHHLLTTARHEWESFNATVTDWERRRGFERL